MFVCAHPAIDAAIRAKLMLQTVLGLNAARIADAFRVSGATMGQRLVRAKQKIRDAGVPFDPREDSEIVERLEAVLEAIYAAIGLGWSEVGSRTDASASGDGPSEALDEEALFLARLLVSLVPEEPECQGARSGSAARARSRSAAEAAR
jgi:RNA polymerase sigma-70 factor (ECF subfamily)